MKKCKLLSVILALLLTFVLVGCKDKEETPKAYIESNISNHDTVVFSGTNNERNYSVTRLDIYEEIKKDSGITLLLEEIDEKLLASLISEITTTDKFYVAKLNRMKYGSDDPDLIEALSADDKTTAQDEFDNAMNILGFTTDEAREAYIKLLAARDKITYEYMKAETQDVKSDYYLTDANFEHYYNNYYFDSAKAIIIDFENQNDYRSTLKEYNLVTFNSELRRYIGTEDIDDIAQSDLNFDNTQALTQAEALEVFVNIYNDVYGYKAAETTASVLTSADFDYKFSVLSSHASSLATYLFSMEKDEYTYITYKSSTDLGNVYSLIYRLDGEDRADFSDLSQDEKDAVLDDYLMALTANSTYTTEALKEYRKEKGLTINDRYFAYVYNTSVDSDTKYLDLEGSSTILAKADNFEISADDYYDYAISRNKAYYYTLAATRAIEETINNFNGIYGSERNLEENASLRKVFFYDQLKASIASGYSADTYGSEEVYIYSKLGYQSFDSALLRYYLTSDLKTIAISESALSLDENGVASFTDLASPYASEVLNDYYNKYYNLYAYRVDVVTDYNKDYVADDLNDVIANPANYGLTQDNINDIEAKLATLFTKISNSLHDHDDDAEIAEHLSEFVNDYNNAPSKGGEYGDYKSLGFKLSYQKVSTSAITYASTHKNSSNQMNAAYRSLFEKIVADSTDNYYLLDAMVKDDSGAHFVLGTKASKTSMPSFKYELSEGSSYNVNAANENNAPTLNQLAGAFLIYYYSLLSDDAECALEDYNISDYPKSYPTTLDFGDYTSALSDYFFSDNYANSYFANIMIAGSDLSDAEKAALNVLANSYIFFLNED